MPNKPKLLILTLFLLFPSCSKPDEKDLQIETLEPHPTWSDTGSHTFFDNLPNFGIQTDATSSGDTTTCLPTP